MSKNNIIQGPGGPAKQNPHQGAPVDMQQVVMKAPNEVCECGSELFLQGVVLRRISAIVSPSGKDEIATLPVLSCVVCKQGHPGNPIKYNVPVVLEQL